MNKSLILLLFFIVLAVGLLIFFLTRHKDDKKLLSVRAPNACAGPNFKNKTWKPVFSPSAVKKLFVPIGSTGSGGLTSYISSSKINPTNMLYYTLNSSNQTSYLYNSQNAGQSWKAVENNLFSGSAVLGCGTFTNYQVAVDNQNILYFSNDAFNTLTNTVCLNRIQGFPVGSYTSLMADIQGASNGSSFYIPFSSASSNYILKFDVDSSQNLTSTSVIPMPSNLSYPVIKCTDDGNTVFIVGQDTTKNVTTLYSSDSTLKNLNSLTTVQNTSVNYNLDINSNGSVIIMNVESSDYKTSSTLMSYDGGKTFKTSSNLSTSQSYSMSNDGWIVMNASSDYTGGNDQITLSTDMGNSYINTNGLVPNPKFPSNSFGIVDIFMSNDLNTIVLLVGSNIYALVSAS